MLKKSAKLQKKALKTSSDSSKLRLEKKAAKLGYKSAKAQMKANRLSKSVGYGHDAMKLSVKSDKFAAKAAKARMKIANNEAYIAKVKCKVAEMPEKDVSTGKQYMDALRRKLRINQISSIGGKFKMGFLDRLQHGWNAFMNKDPTSYYRDIGPSYTIRPDRPHFTRGNERSIVTSVYNRIAIDVAQLDIMHCKLDDNGRLIETMKSGLNDCLTLEANIDQTHRAFIHDVVVSMFDEGKVAIVPVETTLDPKVTKSYDILSMRTGKIMEWYPKHVKVRLYNERTGEKQEVVLPKDMVAIIENPFYTVMNEPNSTMQRLIRKLNLLDVIDEQSGSGKLDLIIQLPYVVKTEARRQQAESRRKDIEDQLKGPYGIAYTDGTERITQLNRPVENNLMKQIEYLTSMLYSQLGITQSILDGSADEQTQLNYITRTVEPIVAAIVDEMKRKFLSKTARTQGQSIEFFRDPFKLVPVNNIAEIADKLTRNEIMTKNEFRQVIGMRPSNDPKADQLLNSNISHPEGTVKAAPNEVIDKSNEGGKIQNGKV